MNKKGFTMVELLVAIVVLALILLIAIPTVNKYIVKGEKVYYSSLQKEVKTTGMDYMDTY